MGRAIVRISSRIVGGFVALGVMLAVLMGCATNAALPESMNAKLKAGYEAVGAYATATQTSLARGRITKDQATRAAANANEAIDKVGTVQDALAACTAPADCKDLLNQLQPLLLQMEADLRAQQAKERSSDRSLLGVITVINDATMLIAAVQPLISATQDASTEAVTAARERAKAAIAALEKAIDAY